MKSILAKATTAFLIIVAGCNSPFAQKGVDPSFISGSVTIGKTETMIGAQKLKLLSNWFFNHSHGWQMIIVTLPLCDYWIELNYKDKETVKLAVYTGKTNYPPLQLPGWRGTVVAYAANPKKNVLRKFLEPDFVDLLSIIAK